MPTLTPKRAESISDVVAPQRFDYAQLRLVLPQDAKATEQSFYKNLPDEVGGSRVGGGSCPTLDICIRRDSYQKVLEELKRYGRLVHSVVFQVSPQGDAPWPTPVEAYLLQGTKTLESNFL